MVSKARLDFPEPDSPVITISRSRGMSTLMFFRLCSRAPRTVILSEGIEAIVSDRYERLFSFGWCSRKSSLPNQSGVARNHQGVPASLDEAGRARGGIGIVEVAGEDELLQPGCARSGRRCRR